MGRFDGILIASDWDGTLFYDGDVSDENVKAIKYFKDNGGLFTVCSGRALSFIKEHAIKVTPNTYAVALNGAYIASLDTGEIFYRSHCDGRLLHILDTVISGGDEYEKVFLHPADDTPSIAYTKKEYFLRREELRDKNYYKAVLVAKNEELGDAGAERSRKYSFPDYTIVRSFRTGLEILRNNNTKDAAIKRLKERLGLKLTVAVGDYENDITMLKAADIGYAVENAIPEVKAAADRITAPCSDSALAKVIYDIEASILPKINP